ncbi:DPP IV N-terminal domain-containing protein [Fulvivirgaceae bacterium BMA10]|uniref:DPP IV N-terminal domain-containing protein n=1 Tax=Splendidivirga corallicola TaxID=3051826 RepID=A0ABT8KX05_9BACT|nr:DPP IV N-terminal domain-containing protein [Fulvivirgaceae bacterium BMA10]
MNKPKTIHLSTLMIITCLINTLTFAQEVTVEDYARAEKFLYTNTSKLVFDMNIRPNWIDGDRFWYRTTSPEGSEFLLVSAKSQKYKQAFDHNKVANALSKLTGKQYSGKKLPFSSFEYTNNEKALVFRVGKQYYSCDTKGGNCKESDPYPHRDWKAIESPDGKSAAFIRDFNLWIRDLTTGKETQLTFDGIEDFGYATNNAGWAKSDRPVLTWSPDSKMIATFQHDARGVGNMYMVSTNVGHPKLYSWKYPLPEDSVIFRIHRVVIHVDDAKVVKLQMGPDQHRSTITDHISIEGGKVSDLEWSKDGSQLAFVSSSRDHKEAILRVADPHTGAVRDVLSETVDTFFESGWRKINWHVLKNTDEVIWYSQRDNWGHLYLYDLKSGQLKKQITSGDWTVLQVLRIDEDTRTIYFTGAGKEPGDPYYQYLYSTSLDVQNNQQLAEANVNFEGVQLLTPANANHVVTLSPSGKYLVDRYSKPDVPPVTVVRSNNGKELMKIGKPDISQLMDNGWKAPESFSVKARDGETDIYGMMFKPSNFDPSKKYPIINYIYPGPQSGSVGSRSFSPSRGDKQSLAELGFIVVAIDAMGTPMRSKSFHAAYYGNMGDNGLPDQITAMKQLAAKYSWIDIDRVGIYGHSGGGFASTDAILRYPDFFKVAVSSAGNHDNRNYEDDWGEKWQGLLKKNADGTTNYDNQANQLLVKNLKGKLLLAHGTLDSNVPVSNTMLVVNELIAANKDFDLILFPNRGHGFGNEAYMMRRRWDYFVEHLLGVEPPREYKIGAGR